MVGEFQDADAVTGHCAISCSREPLTTGLARFSLPQTTTTVVWAVYPGLQEAAAAAFDAVFAEAESEAM